MNEEELFLQALQKTSPDERKQFLDEACAGNSSLREAVDQLLRAHEKVGEFLERGHQMEVTEIRPLTEQPGDTIGPYKLLQQIGEGGMGVVYMAEQTEPVERRVALKIIKPGMDSEQVIARFEAERQALAMMDHPNIAKVLDAGTTETGRPYFVMELVKGMPVTQYCDEQHLTPRERLELFLPICQAVQHAHQKGIIHRDLKPSNILVAQYDNKAVPKVIDFGVAKAISHKLTEKTMFTQYGQIVGTIEYMSPEQARFNQLDVDTRSDIYSLGVLLYELLTGETPFDKQRLRSAAFDELLRIIREEEPPKPSTKLSSSEALANTAVNRKMEPRKLSLLVRGDLDWIVMKALEKDRNRRYETANAFAADVQRYLTDEPVTACPPSAGYRFRKFARRNKGSLAVAALVLFFLVLLGSGVGWVVRDRSLRDEQAARERADRRGRISGQVVSILDEVHRIEEEEDWPKALAAAQRAHAVVAGGEVEPAVEAQVQQTLRDLQLVQRLEQIRLERVPQSDGKLDHTSSVAAYAQAFRDYGVDLEQVSLQEAIARLHESTHLRVAFAAAIDDFANDRTLVFGGTDPLFPMLVSISRGLDPDPTRDQLRELWLQADVTKLPTFLGLVESLDIGRQYPATLSLIGRGLWRKGYKEQSLWVLTQARAHHPDDFWLNLDLAQRLQSCNNFHGAVRYYSVAVALRPHLSSVHNNLGEALCRVEQMEEAEACFRRACEVNPSYATAYFNRGIVQERLGRLEESIKSFKRAIEIQPDHLAAFHMLIEVQTSLERTVESSKSITQLAQERQNLWERQLDQLPLDPNWNSARMRLCREIAADAELFGALQKLRPHDADLSIARGQILAQAEKWDEAAEWFGRVIDSRGLSEDALQSACLHLLTDRPDAYRHFCTKLIGQAGDVSDPDVAFILARTCILVPETAASPEQIVRWAERAVSGGRSPWALHVLGAASCRAGRYDRAIELLEESTASKWSAAGEAQNALMLAIAHSQQGNSEAATTCLDRARTLMATEDRPPPPDWLEYHVLVREAEALIEVRP